MAKLSTQSQIRELTADVERLRSWGNAVVDYLNGLLESEGPDDSVALENNREIKELIRGFTAPE